MSRRDSRRPLSGALADAAAAYQAAEVIPHCSVCAKPCCRLDKLVLELAWKQVRSFWRVDVPRGDFDRHLAAGQGPEEIRAANGLYYVHSKPCPAYDEVQRGCRVYGQPIKPAGCSDFPVYEDDGCIVADLRCEAVDLASLVGWISRALGPDFRVVQSADEAFPFLVTLSVKRTNPRRSR